MEDPFPRSGRSAAENVAAAIAVGNTNTTPKAAGERYDLVMAVIFLDSLYLVFNIVYLMFLSNGHEAAFLMLYYVDFGSGVGYIFVGKLLLSIIFLAFGIHGAATLRRDQVNAAALWLCIEVIPNFIFFRWVIALPVFVLLPLPNWCLYKEMKRGNITSAKTGYSITSARRDNITSIKRGNNITSVKRGDNISSAIGEVVSFLFEVTEDEE